MKARLKNTGELITVLIMVLVLLAGCPGRKDSISGTTKPASADKLIDPTAPALGPEKAKAVIVEFVDFQCPACAQGSAIVETVRQKAPEEIRVVWMDRPLSEIQRDGISFHPYAELAHEAAAEAQAQGKFWEMKKWIFDHQREMFARERPKNQDRLDDQLSEIAGQLVAGGEQVGLDPAQLKAALADHRHRAAVEKRLAMAKALGINGTPTIFVNGQEIETYDGLTAAVEKALGRPLGK